jgi:hypothetical protein
VAGAENAPLNIAFLLRFQGFFRLRKSIRSAWILVPKNNENGILRTS